MDGGTVRLTIDEDLQYLVQKYLDHVDPAVRRRGGQVTVLDAGPARCWRWPSNGAVQPAGPVHHQRRPVAGPQRPAGLRARLGQQDRHDDRGAGEGPDHARAPCSACRTPSTSGGITVHDAWWHPIQKFTATGVLAESSNVGTLLIAAEGRQADLRRLPAAVRARPEDRHRAARRERRPAAAAEQLVRRHLRQPADRAGGGDDLAAAGLDVPDGGQRRGADPAADRRVGHRSRTARSTPTAQPAGIQVMSAGDRQDGAHHAGVGDAQGRHRQQGRHRRLPGGRQDRHRPAARPEDRPVLRLRLLGHLRRHGAGRQPAVRGRRS